MWIAYAATSEAARELTSRLLAEREGEIVWVAWEMSATWIEALTPTDIALARRRMREERDDAGAILLALISQDCGDEVAVLLMWWMATTGEVSA